MKPRKRARSPNTDESDVCLPISKRINRLNIQSSSRQSLEDAEKQQQLSSPEVQGQACSSAEVYTGVNGFPWQQTGVCGAGVYPHGNNNNQTTNTCGSVQCDSEQMMSNQRNGLLAYASHHNIPMNDFSGYKPELDITQNPHYYQINSVLYQAHLEKASRQGSEIKH